MKKVISLLLALVMCLSLCACGGDKAPEMELKDYVVGTWERNFISSDGQEIKQVIEVYKGGTGKFLYYSQEDGSFTANWEINDNVLNFTYGSLLPTTLGLILDTETKPMTLTRVDDPTAIFVKTE